MALPDDFDRLNPDLLSLLPRDARRIVEVGCGAGALGAAYRSFNPAVEYTGIEAPGPAAEMARRRLDRVLSLDVETLKRGALGSEADAMDCLVLGDVLPRLRDPWTVMARMVGWLREGGQVLACFPNVQHWSVLAGLIRGEWNDAAGGLLDRTHLRFFTMDSALRLFREAGLWVYWLSPRESSPSGGEAFRRSLEPAARGLGVDPARFDLGTRAFQFVLGGVKTAKPPPVVLLQTIYGSFLGAEARVREPHAFLATIPGMAVREAPTVAELMPPSDGVTSIVIRQRNLLRPDRQTNEQRELIRQGHLIVAEFDDDPDHFPDVVAGDYFALTSCHAVQTSTVRMAETLARHHPVVRVFPNQIAWLPPRRTRADEPVTLFFGALNREQDWAPILPALNELLNELGPAVRVRVVHDRAFFESLETDRKDFEPTCPYTRYQEILATADVALLPLRDTRFNQHKSDLKFLECAAHGVVCLASPTVYGSSIRDGQTGLIYRDAPEFSEALRALLTNPELRRTLAKSAYEEMARHRMLARHYRQRYEWYLTLANDKPRLDVALRQRHPELFPHEA